VAKRTFLRGKTSATVTVFIRHATTGAPLTGLVFNTASLVCSYAIDQNSRTAVTLATLAAANSAWSSGGFKEIDATNMPGMYRFDPPNAALATGEGVAFSFTGANALCNFEFDLWSVNIQDTVRMGLTALPNVASGAAGAIITNGTGTAQLATTTGNVALTATGNTAVVTELMGTTTENNGSLTFKGLMRILTTVVFGRVSISGSTVTFKTADNAKTRATVVTDSSNQRTTVTLDATD
jgi:hypothetical protein